MKQEVLKKFKRMFEEQKKSFIFTDTVMREDFHVKPDECKDDVDQATNDIDQNLRLRLRNRENLYLKKVEEALRRIEDRTFGVCNSCDGDIEIKRLEARPTATLCIACKEEEERREVLTADGRRHKSLGVMFSRATS